MKRSIIALVVLLGVGCAPQTKEAYLRDAARAHVVACASVHPSPMRSYWCQQDETDFCKANGLEQHCGGF